jgi:molybdenum ABC transporter molybdate-binding protein
MKRRLARSGLALAAVALTTAAAAEEVHLYAAASLTDAVRELAGAFEQETGHKVVFNFGGSNDLARQIKAGAPADVFFSADAAQMDGLQAAGLVRAQERVDVLSNVLVVVAPLASTTTIAAPRDLLGLNRLALADPEAVLERPRADLALERLDLGDGLHLLGEALEAGLVQAQPVEHPLVDAVHSRLAVGCVRGEDLCSSLPHEYGCAPQGGGDRLVGQTRCGAACLARLLLDRLA